MSGRSMCGLAAAGVVCGWLVMAVGGEDAATGQAAEPPREFKGLPLVFVEDFEQTRSLLRWEPTDDQAWRLAMDGERAVYAQYKMSDYQPPVRSPLNVSLLKDVYVSDFVLDAWVRSTRDSGAHRDMCLFFGHQSAQRFYYVHFGAKADPVSHMIHRVDAKPREPIATKPSAGCAWTGDRYHHLRVIRDVAKGTITAYFDDMETPALAAEDKTFAWGRIGLGSFDDTGQFDRVILWGRKIDPPTTRPAGPSGS